MSFDIDIVLRYGPLLLSGLWTTVYICALASLLAVAAGLAAALIYSLPFRSVKLLCRIYIEVMRGTPILVLLFIVYYGGPSIGLTLEAETVGSSASVFTAAAISRKSSGPGSSPSRSDRLKPRACSASRAGRSSPASRSRRC